MKKTVSQLFFSPIYICALACILMACKLPTATPTRADTVNTIKTSSTQREATPTQTSMKAYVGNGYSISYPTAWQFNTNTTNAGNYQGDYFTDATNMYAFHVYPSQDQTSPATILKQLLTSIPGSQLLASTPTITVHGIVWQQGKAVRTDADTGKQLEIMGWVAKNPLAAQHIPYFVLHADGAPDNFDRYTSAYFLPILQTFHFTN
jgi:hypothetical protein